MFKRKKKMDLGSIILLISLVMFVCVIVALVINHCVVLIISRRSYRPDIVLTSPDGKYELVVRAYDCISGAGAEVYIRKTGWYNGWTKKKIGDVHTDDYYMPFSKGEYYVEWEDDKVTLCYCKGLGGFEDKNDPSTWVGVLSYDLN